jgi:hypothetical protein
MKRLRLTAPAACLAVKPAGDPKKKHGRCPDQAIVRTRRGDPLREQKGGEEAYANRLPKDGRRSEIEIFGLPT